MSFSDPETKLLQEIQRDSSLSLAELSVRSGMAQSTVWRKLQDFETNGVLRARVALLNPDKIGCKLTVLAAIKLENHMEPTVSGFGTLIESQPEIIECHAVSGDADYRIKIRVADVDAYEKFITNTLLRNGYVRSIESSFVLKELKSTTELPLGSTALDT